MVELIYKDESYAIIGACMAVYKEKGCGFLEPVYHECSEIELELQGILRTPPQQKPRTCRCLSLKFLSLFACFVGGK
ncbi:MAG: hypothetical protein DMF43_02460 [Verrucomicrobia bacterium]|nr:MAG: hypothetical protein DMF43_02460 [Verrucomicrobiota bacterium]